MCDYRSGCSKLFDFTSKINFKDGVLINHCASFSGGSEETAQKGIADYFRAHRMNGALCTRSMFSNTKDWAQRAAALRHQLQDAWHDVQEEDGLLFTKNFLALLRKLRYQPKTARANKTGYVPATDVEAVAALQAMGMTQYHIQDGVFLRYSTMVRAFRCLRGTPRQVRRRSVGTSTSLTFLNVAGKVVSHGHARRARRPKKQTVASTWPGSRAAHHLHAPTCAYSPRAGIRTARMHAESWYYRSPLTSCFPAI